MMAATISVVIWFPEAKLWEKEGNFDSLALYGRLWQFSEMEWKIFKDINPRGPQCPKTFKSSSFLDIVDNLDISQKSKYHQNIPSSISVWMSLYKWSIHLKSRKHLFQKIYSHWYRENIGIQLTQPLIAFRAEGQNIPPNTLLFTF